MDSKCLRFGTPLVRVSDPSLAGDCGLTLEIVLASDLETALLVFLEAALELDRDDGLEPPLECDRIHDLKATSGSEFSRPGGTDPAPVFGRLSFREATSNGAQEGLEFIGGVKTIDGA